MLSFWVRGSCLVSGIIWFIALDWLQIPVPRLRLWWILHGCCSLLGLLLVGAALPQHLIATWKGRKNLINGIVVLASFASALLSAMALFYPPEDWRALIHWIHCITCLILALVPPADRPRSPAPIVVLSRIPITG